MYCPKCGRVMQDLDGILTCVPGDMPLSRNLQGALTAKFPTQRLRSDDVEVGYQVLRWFCPGCGVPLASWECPQCGVSLLPERFALVERHPHKTEDGKWV